MQHYRRKQSLLVLVPILVTFMAALISPLTAEAAGNCSPSIAPSTASADQAISQAYSSWKATYVTSNGADGQLRVQRSASNNYDTVSEGIGYGLLFAAANNDRTTFTKLWNYEQAHLDSNGLMNWDISNSGATIGFNGATDADEDMAFALVMADKAWGGYTTAATSQISHISQHEIEAGSYVVKPGDDWGGSNLLNPSYLAPAYYAVFQTYTGDTSWSNVSAASYKILEAIRSNTPAKTTGLIPDWSTASGQPVSGMSYNYSYDASRAPIRLAMANQWNCDANAAAALAPLNSELQSIGITNLVAGYTLDGSPAITNASNGAILAASAAAATASSDTTYRDAAWKALVNASSSGYFPDSLRLLSLLVSSGTLTNPLQTTMASQPAATSSAAASTSTTPQLQIWWPSSGSPVSGVQPFKAMVTNTSVQNYTMYWQVDGGSLNAMNTNTADYPHKEASVDLSSWDWRGSGPYTITFVAKDASGATLATASTKITIKN